MKKLSLVLVLAMIMSICSFGAFAESEYSQSPRLDARVEAGELPPVEERLPENPAAPTDMTEEDLRALALDKAKEVKKWGESVTLSEMNAHDRRIIHVTLQDDEELTTRSEGEGSMKKVVISLKKD